MEQEFFGLKQIAPTKGFFANQAKGLFSFSPRVEEVGSYYAVYGINVNAFAADLRNNFGTTVIFTRIIKQLSSSSFKIHKFFMVEFAWILEHLVGQDNKKVVNKYIVGIRKYTQLLDEIKQKTWVISTYQTFEPYNVDKALLKFRNKPFEDQHAFLLDYSRIKQGFHLRGCLLDAAVGSGKTITSMIWAEMMGEGKIIVTVPKGLVSNPWMDEIKTHYKDEQKIWTSLDGTDILDHTDCKYFIIHKEQIRTGAWNHAFKILSENGKKPLRMIIDESHNYNTPSSAQSLGLIETASSQYISDVLFMSGTPIKAQGKETFTLFAVIDPFFTENVRKDFLKMYGRDNTYLNEMLAHRLGRIKYTIKAITSMAPPPEPITVKVSFPGAELFTLENIRKEMMMYITDRVDFYAKHADQYYRDWRDFIEGYRIANLDNEAIQAKVSQYYTIVEKFRRDGFNNFTDAPLSKFANDLEKDVAKDLRGKELHYFRHIKSTVKYVGLKIRGEALGNVVGKARMEAVRGVIAHAELPKYIESAKKKTLVYTSYVDVIYSLMDYFESVGFEAVSLYGDNANDIDKIIGDFANKETQNPLITTFNTLREGKQMLMANQILLMNAPFRSYELTQTIARVYRRGQTEECFIYLFDLDTGDKENITTRSIDIMQWSEDMVNQLLGGGQMPGYAKLGVNASAVGGMETLSGMVWDVPRNDPELDIDDDTNVERAMPKKAGVSMFDLF